MAKKKVRKRSQKIAEKIIIIVILGIIVLIGIEAIKIIDLKKQEAELDKQLTVLTEQKASLESTLLYIATPEYVEQMARDTLKMIKPDETLYVLPEDENKDDILLVTTDEAIKEENGD